ncbi:MAG TPA: MBL fold metallo-hydrolase [Saprospiraceae bacterium]|nr:MBL fold metallo-hydrolase [Saprospiraceae bacterium]
MNVAERIIKPTKPNVFRTVFLYTGQGESTLFVIPTGSNIDDYKYVLLDSDRDKEPNEIDLINMFKDLFKTKGKLDVFINTHPHNDHIGGIKDVYDEIKFSEVWHSNHKPGKKHKDKYEGLKYVIDKVGKKNEYFLYGTNDINKIRTSDDKEVIKKLGNIDYQVLSPAEYLSEDINEENQDVRDARIHEQCGVIKFTYGKEPKSIMITGDSDKEAWKEHITKYHKEVLPSIVLSSSHHGSRSFFKKGKDDDNPYEEHIKKIAPTYLIISAPKQKDSPHGHPHDDAMEIYKKYVEEDGIFHLGSKPYSVIIDIDDNGNIEIKTDEELIETYGKGNDDGEDGGAENTNIYVKPQTTRIDDKPMGKL